VAEGSRPELPTAAVMEDAIWRGTRSSRRPGGWGGYQDPVLGYVPLPPLLRQALDLRPVQRLRSIKQLSGLDLVYPGATHTRFEHAVGVMWLAGQAHDVLYNKIEYRGSEWPRLNVATKIAVMLAGLFHDLGHGPYSHTYDMFREREPSSVVTNMPHERRSMRVIQDRDPDLGVGAFLDQIAQDLRERRVPAADLVRPDIVAAIAVGDPIDDEADAGFGTEHRLADYSFLGTIVASDFDVDRLDYLRRDAVHTGVPAGVNPGEVISAYTLARVSQTEPEFAGDDRAAEPGESDDPLVWRLKLERHAAMAYESMLATRDLAYRKLYYQRTHRAGQEMLILALQILTGRYPETSTSTSPDELASLNDYSLLSEMKTAAAGNAKLQALYEGVVHRRLYEPLPTSIRVHLWPEVARARLAVLQKAENQKLRESMLDVAKSIGLNTAGTTDPDGRSRPAERVLVDIAATPVAQARAYDTRVLIDEDGEGQLIRDALGRRRKIGYSLNELLPHVNALHGVRLVDRTGLYTRDDRGNYLPASPTREPLHPAYVAQMQSILIFVPSTFLDRIHERVRGASDRAAESDQIYRDLIEPILRGFWDVIASKFPPGAWHESFEHAAQTLRAWLRSATAFPSEGRRITPPFLD